MSGTPSRASHDPTPSSGGCSVANALILADPSSAGGHCPPTREAHDGTATPASANGFLRVAFTRAGRRPPEEWVRAARATGSSVFVVDATPCSGGSDTTDADDHDRINTLDAVSPDNLTDIGVRITEALDRIEAERPSTEADYEVVCCLGSLTALLQYVDDRRAYRFINAVTSRVATHGGVVHAHLQPALHDRQTVDTMASLFDAVAEPSADGDGLDVIRRRHR